MTLSHCTYIEGGGEGHHINIIKRCGEGVGKGKVWRMFNIVV